MIQTDLIHMIYNAGLMVQFVLLVLLFFSITSWAIMIIKYRYIKRAFKESAYFTDLFWKSRDLSNAFVKAKRLHGSPIAKVFRVGYLELEKLSRSSVSITSQSQLPSDAKITSLSAEFAGIDNIKRALRRAVKDHR